MKRLLSLLMLPVIAVAFSVVVPTSANAQEQGKMEKKSKKKKSTKKKKEKKSEASK